MTETSKFLSPNKSSLLLSYIWISATTESLIYKEACNFISISLAINLMKEKVKQQQMVDLWGSAYVRGLLPGKPSVIEGLEAKI